MCKIAIRNACMKQDDIARVLNVSQSVVSRPLKEHLESGSTRKRNGLHWFLIARNCYWSIMVRGALSDDHMIQLKVITGTKVPGHNSWIWCKVTLGLARYLEHGARRWHCKTSLYSHLRGIQKSTEHCKTSMPSLLLDLNPIEHVWDKLGWCVWTREPAVSKPLWILLDSTAWVGQDFMSWTHVPSEFNVENVPSCYSTVWRLYTT